MTVSTQGEGVTLRALSKSFGATPVVRGVDLDVAPGEMLALLGPSGCGKTTTLRMVAGLIEPTGGDVLIGGRSVLGVPAHRRDLGMLFQAYGLFPHLTVARNVAFGLEMRRIPKAEAVQRVAEALKLVRLDTFAERMPAQLSGGQQQRVALARALVYRPRVLLLDEPFGALDRKLREEMQVELRLLVKRLGLTTIMVTHDQEEALTLADRLAVMEHGQLMQVGTGAEVYDRPASRFVADFMGVANLLDGRVVETGAVATLEAAKGVHLWATPIAAPPAKGSLGTVAIRPEAIALLPPDPPAEAGTTTLAGTVEQAIFKGQGLDVWVGTAAGRILARLDRGALAAPPDPGAACALRFAAARAILLPREPESA